MSSLTTTWLPNSFQLRRAFNGRKTPPLFFVRTTRDRIRIRLFSAAQNGLERRRSGDSWVVNSNSSSDGFAGWTDNEQSGHANGKQPLKGIVGAGVAGVVLVVGLTFAALSIGKRNPSGLKQQMEPLKAQHEMSLESDDRGNMIKEDKNDKKHGTDDSTTQQSIAGIDKDYSSSTEINEATESKDNDGTDMDDTPRDGDLTYTAPIQQDFQNESVIDDMPVDPEDLAKPPDNQIASSSFATSGSECKDTEVPSEKPEPVSETEEDNLVKDLSLFSTSKTDLSICPQDELSGTRDTENLNSSFDTYQSDPAHLNISVISELDTALEPKNTYEMDIYTRTSTPTKEFDLDKTQNVSDEGDESSLRLQTIARAESPGTTSVSDVDQLGNVYKIMNQSSSSLDSGSPGNVFTSAGIPAPSVVSAAVQANPGKVLVPAVVDQVQGQVLAALQALKVIESNVQPGDLCTRREYARWLVSASSALSRSTVSKVYPAMYIENVTELAFDDITVEDPDFPSIQGLAEAGLISSKLSRRDLQTSLDDDLGPLCFSPESPLARQDLVSWKMALEKKPLPVVDRKSFQEISGFIDVDKINPDAWPALVADIAARDQGIMALAFGYTRLFQPDKPVTKAQAAIALATGEASDIVSEELARIEAESMAEKVVTAHNALVAQVEKDVNATYEKELQLEREKIDAVEKLAESARRELERLRAEREQENLTLMKERAAVDSEMEVLSRLRREVEEQLHTLMSNKVEISYEKERLSKLRKDAEIENQEIVRLQYELEVERKALSMARSWAEEEAKRARDQAKTLEEARERWASQGIRVVVDDDLREEENAGVTWLRAGKEVAVEGTIDRAENLVDRLKAMANGIRGQARDGINKIIQMMLRLIDILKEWILKAGRQAGELKDTTISKLGSSLQEVQQSSIEFSSAAKGGIKRVAEDCREGVEKITQKFKT